MHLTSAFSPGSVVLPSSALTILTSTTLQTYRYPESQKELFSILGEVVELMGGSRFCSPCWWKGLDNDHGERHCEGAAIRWSTTDNPYQLFKKEVKFVKGHCYKCGMFQVSIDTQLFIQTYSNESSSERESTSIIERVRMVATTYAGSAMQSGRMVVLERTSSPITTES